MIHQGWIQVPTLHGKAPTYKLSQKLHGIENILVHVGDPPLYTTNLFTLQIKQ